MNSQTQKALTFDDAYEAAMRASLLVLKYDAERADQVFRSMMEGFGFDVTDDGDAVVPATLRSPTAADEPLTLASVRSANHLRLVYSRP